jgi:hypothetical protein
LAQVISQVDAIENQVLEEVEGLCRFEADVRLGSKADMCGATTYVRFTPNTDRESEIPQ